MENIKSKVSPKNFTHLENLYAKKDFGAPFIRQKLEAAGKPIPSPESMPFLMGGTKKNSGNFLSGVSPAEVFRGLKSEGLEFLEKQKVTISARIPLGIDSKKFPQAEDQLKGSLWDVLKNIELKILDNASSKETLAQKKSILSSLGFDTFDDFKAKVLEDLKTKKVPEGTINLAKVFFDEKKAIGVEPLLFLFEEEEERKQHSKTFRLFFRGQKIRKIIGFRLLCFPQNPKSTSRRKFFGFSAKSGQGIQLGSFCH